MRKSSEAVSGTQILSSALLVIDERVAISIRPLNDLSILDLPGAAFAAQLSHDFDLMIPAHDVRFGEQTPVGVHRELSADFDPAVLGKAGRFPRLAEAEAFKRDPGNYRERVVGEERVNLLGCYSGHFVHALLAGLILKY